MLLKLDAVINRVTEREHIDKEKEKPFENEVLHTQFLVKN
jgi:hypothetical protein